MSLQRCELQPVSTFNNMKRLVEGAQLTSLRTGLFPGDSCVIAAGFAPPSRVQTRMSKKESKRELALACTLARGLVLQLLLKDI